MAVLRACRGRGSYRQVTQYVYVRVRTRFLSLVVQRVSMSCWSDREMASDHDLPKANFIKLQGMSSFRGKLVHQVHGFMGPCSEGVV